VALIVGGVVGGVAVVFGGPLIARCAIRKWRRERKLRESFKARRENMPDPAAASSHAESVPFVPTEGRTSYERESSPPGSRVASWRDDVAPLITPPMSEGSSLGTRFP